MGRKKRRKINSLNREAPLIARLHVAERLRETFLLFTWALALFIVISLITYHNSDASWSHVVDTAHVSNAAGKVGAWLSDILLYGFGYAAYLFPVLLAYGAWIYYRVRHKEEEKSKPVWPLFSLRFFGFILVISSFSALMSEHFLMPLSQLPYSTGGVLGSSLGTLLLQMFSMTGATLLATTLFLVGFTLFSGMSWLKAAEKIGALIANKVPVLAQGIAQKIKSYLNLRRSEKPELDEFVERRAPKISRAVVSDNEEPRFAQQALNLIKPNIVRPTKMVEEEVELPHQAPRFTGSEVLPEISLLDPAPEENAHTVYDDEQLAQKSNDVEMRLKDFGVQVKVVAVHPGPVVTRFELQLAAGTKVSKISTLAKDLARSLSVLSVRVVEVIPGKSVIGLELPNEKRQVVSLREVLATKTYQNARSPLSLALGKDIAGHPVIVDLAKMPHLLVAGTTGSGKSVGLNAMLLSLLYKSSPTKLRMILIDPKMLEMAVYDGIPHLLSPVVTDMKDAASALRWCVVEMERRYRLMASLGVRNLMGYNQKIEEAKARKTPLFDPLRPEQKVELEELPRIVVLADEFADMMVVVGKKVETLIARLAQKARAAGIHLIFATQRPSVDVITGLIKANIPTRIAFQVSSKIDSRTILDQQGAEQLLGNGDMLYLPPGSGVPVRVHGAYVTDDEVHRVVSYLKEHGEPEYIENLLDENAGTDTSGFVQAAMGGVEIEGEQDPLYDEAVEVVVQSQRVSISSIQRRFKIGYNRAACIVEAMEAAGVVSKMEQSGLREVLVPRAQE